MQPQWTGGSFKWSWGGPNSGLTRSHRNYLDILRVLQKRRRDPVLWVAAKLDGRPPLLKTSGFEENVVFFPSSPALVGGTKSFQLREKPRQSTDLEEYDFIVPKNFSNSKQSKSQSCAKIGKKWRIFFFYRNMLALNMRFARFDYTPWDEHSP